MKKSISLLLTVLILLSTMTVLTLLPTTTGSAAASGPANLITNGDASGVALGGALKLKYDDSDRGEGYPNNSLLGYTYYYDNGRYLYNPYGWRNNDTRYNYIELDSATAWPLNDSTRFTNFSADYGFRLKGWTQAMQNVELEENKIYRVAAKVTQRPTTANPAGDWQFDMFLDAKTTTTASATRPTAKDWNLTRGHSIQNEVISKFNDKSKTLVYGGNTHYYFGDFEEYSFTFNSNDFIAENSLTKNQNGKYDARFVILNYSAAWLMFDDVSITEVIEVKATEGGIFTGDIKTDGTPSTLTATAYYGNKFLGWYSTSGKLISDSPVFSGVIDQSMIAAFEQHNLIANGDFEAPNLTETAILYNSFPKYDSSVYGIASPAGINTDKALYGDNCLSLMPSQITTGSASNAKLKGLISIPVELKADTNYIWKFSYNFYDVTYVSSKHYLKFSIDNPSTNGRPAWSSSVDYSFHSQRPKMDGVDEWEYAWGRNTNNAGTLENQGASAANDWVDMYIIFTTKEAGTYYLTLGTAQALTDAVMLDNISLTETTTSGDATTATVEGNGKIYSHRLGEQPLRATEARGSATVFGTLEPTPYVNQMYITLSAKADRGSVFKGWYEGDKLVSTNTTIDSWSVGKNYVAKFEVDKNKYTVSAFASDNCGFVTYDSDETEFYRDDQITLTAHGYKGNSFIGWYDGNSLLSTDEVYTINIEKNLNLEARFKKENLFCDSGFENTEVATSLMDSNHWYIDGDDTATYADVVAVSAATGKNSLAIRAPGQKITHKAFTVSKNTDYHLSFDWRTANAYADDNISGLALVQVIDAENGTVLAEDANFKASLGTAGWKQAYLNFNTAGATSVRIVIVYNAKASAMFIDDIALFGTANTKFEISAGVENKNGYFGGYITSDKLQKVALGDSVTVSASGYDRNKFLGWFEDGEKVSDSAAFTFTADRYRKLTAVFSKDNLSIDSGFENTAPDTDMTKYGWKGTLSSGSFIIKNGAANSGKNYLNISHKNKEFSYELENLEPHSYYVFSFYARFDDNIDNATVDYVKVLSDRTGIEFAAADNMLIATDWERVNLYFNTQQETSLSVKFLYTATKGDLRIDDVTLYKAHNVLVTAGKGGSATANVSGAASEGTIVTATATADNGNRFIGWFDYNTRKTLISTNSTYTFKVGEGASEIIAYFEGDGAEEINYFTDGDFENKTGVDIVFSHPTWTNIDDDYYDYVEATTSGVTPISGNKMLAIQANGHYTNIMIPDLKPNTDYTLSYWLYLEENSAFNMAAVMPYYPERASRLEQSNQGATYVKYQAFDAGQATSMAESHAYILGVEQPNGCWRKVVLQFNSGNTPTEYLHISASILGIPYYIDDLRITEGTSGYSEELVNGDFSSPNAENGWLDDYEELSEGSNKFARFDSFIRQNLKLSDTEGYTLTFRAKSENGGRLFYGFTTGGNELLTTKNAVSNLSYGYADLSDSWQEYSLDFSTTNHMFNSLQFISANGKDIDIDDVKLTPATDLVPVERFTFEDSEIKYDFVAQRGLAGIVGNNADWFEYSAATAHGGSYSLKMKHKNNFASHPLIQDWTTLALYSGRTYRFSYWVKGAEGDQFRFRVMTNDKNWHTEALIDSVETLENNGWNQIEYYFTVDFIELTTGKQVEFSIDGVEGKSTADIYFDDFYIEESDRIVTSHSANMLYTQDLSQNFIDNYNFERDGDIFERFIKSGDAFFGERYITVNKGDRIVVPVTTRRDITYPFHSQYTLAASIKSDASSKGTVSLAVDAKGEKIIKDKSGKEANLLSNTNGAWKRSGFSFENTDIVTLYLVIECTGGSFSLDYLSLFNRLHEYEENTNDLNEYPVFDKNNPDNFIDAGSYKGENLILGTLYDLPEGSKVILQGSKNYEAVVSASGEYEIRNIANGTYNLLVLPSDSEYATMWGDITFRDGKATGLGLTRLSGTVLTINGQGVKNGIAKISDTATGYGYLTATNDEGYFKAYIIDSSWELVGTTNDTALAEKYSLKFASAKNAIKIAVDTDIYNAAPFNFAAIITVVITFIMAAAILIITRKKGENA